MLFPGGSPTLGSPVRGSLPVGKVQQVLSGPLPVQQQQLQQHQVQATAQQAGNPQQQQQQQVQPRQQQQQVQEPFQSPPPGPRTGFAFSSDFKNRIWPNQNSTICAPRPDWAWLKDVTPAYLFKVAFYKFRRQRATAIARIPDGAVKPCWHDESITGHWCIGYNTVRGCIVTPPKWTPLPLPHLPIVLGPRRTFMSSMSKIREDMCLSACMPSVDKVEKSQ